MLTKYVIRKQPRCTNSAQVLGTVLDVVLFCLPGGRRINAAGSISLVAMSAGQGRNILIQGRDLKAAQDIALAADHQIQLLASQGSSQQHSNNSGISGGIGVRLCFGHGAGNDLTLNLSGSKSVAMQMAMRSLTTTATGMPEPTSVTSIGRK